MIETSRLARRLGMMLVVWSLSSMVVGVLLLVVPMSMLQGIGVQAALWGIINVIIAVAGILRQKKLSADKAARFLRINVFLDVGYQLVGILLIVFLWYNAFLLGNGIGIIIQGAFLFVLDLYFYRRFKALEVYEPPSQE